jgi:hypothetical protein
MKNLYQRVIGTAAGICVFAAALIFAGCEVAPTDGTTGDGNNPIRLYEDSFAKGEVAKDSEQWFSFYAASTGTYYIYVIFDTLECLTVRVFDPTDYPVGGEANLWERRDDWSFSRELTKTGTYRIRVEPYYSGDSGTYRIGFNKTATPPSR